MLLQSSLAASALRVASIQSSAVQTRRLLHATLHLHRQFFNADTKTFENVISAQNSEGKIVLVDFYADWCNPCKMLSPVMEKLTGDGSVKSGSGRSLDLVTVDTDAEFELAQKYKVRAMPTVIAFKDGKPIDQFVGALNETGVRNFLQGI